MKLTWLLVGLVGCGGSQQPTAATTPIPHDSPAPAQFTSIPPFVPTFLSAPRPPISIDVSAKPDLDDEARWPLALASHPMLEPHFDVARALAQPGITWTDLCTRGLANRHLGGRDQELGDYLVAWCAVAKHDTKDALYRLGTLRSSPRLRDAIRADVADILVEHGGANDIEGLLSRSGLLELDIVDRLAASYHEVGREPDAFATNQLAIGMDREPALATACHRLVREAATGDAEHVSAATELLDAIVQPKHAALNFVPEPTCRVLRAKVQCAVTNHCDDYWVEVYGRDVRHIISAATAWPTDTAGCDRWLWIVKLAMDGGWLEDAFVLAVPALKMAIDTSMCTSANLDVITERIGELLALRHNARFDGDLRALDARIRDLSALSPVECQTRLRDQVSKHP